MHKRRSISCLSELHPPKMEMNVLTLCLPRSSKAPQLYSPSIKQTSNGLSLRTRTHYQPIPALNCVFTKVLDTYRHSNDHQYNGFIDKVFTDIYPQITQERAEMIHCQLSKKKKKGFQNTSQHTYCIQMNSQK